LTGIKFALAHWHNVLEVTNVPDRRITHRVGGTRGVGTGDAGVVHHALTPVGDLPVQEVLSATHILCDPAPNLGTVVHDYLATERKKP